MKVILFSYGLVGGGAERIASVIFNGLVERGHKVAIVTHPNIKPVYYLSPQIKLLYYNVNSNVRPVKRVWNIIKSIRRIVKQERPDVAIGLMRYYAGYLLLGTLGLRQRIIAWDHSSCRIKDLDFNSFWRKYFLYAFFDRTFVLTEEDKKNVWFKHNVRVMPNALSFAPLSKFPQKEKVILGVGNFNSWKIKGFDLLVKAWSMIEKSNPEWMLNIVGGGDRSEIQKIIESESIGNRVVLLDFNSHIQDSYRDASVFVLSSRQEGFSLVLLEAMSRGCACVACDNNNRTKEVLKKGGIIYQTGDVKDLAEKLQTMLSDSNQMKEYGKIAMKESSKFSLDKILDNWEYELSNLKI